MEESQCQWEDIKGIVASQPDLRLLGFHRRNRMSKSLLTISKILHRDLSHLHPMPTIFMLDFYNDYRSIILELVPSYHLPGEALEAFREIEPYLNSSNRYTLQLDLFAISENNIHLFREVMEAAGTFRLDGFEHLNIIVRPRQVSIQVSHQRLKYYCCIILLQSPWRFPEFVEPLMHFRALELLTFSFRYFLAETTFHPLSVDMRLCLAKSDLEMLCPKLQVVNIWSKGHRGIRMLILRRPRWLPERW